MPRKRESRVLIDTNIFISFLIGKQLKGLKDQLVQFKVRLIFSEQIIQEIRIVTQKSKLAKHFPKSNIEELIDLIYTIGDNIEISKEPEICRDPKDNFLLEIADKGKADYLVTGDDDLLILTKYKHTKIISYKEFERLLVSYKA
ncbi:MAG: putative toxin-antitoxin system toxin component, PIN family [Bacteroidales bacterium]